MNPLTDDMVYEGLLCLGPTSRDVAAALFAAGVRGKRATAGCCPVANWLRQEFGGPAYVDGLFGDVFDGESHGYVRLPAPIQQFVTDFDYGMYPGLDSDYLEERSGPFAM